VTAWLVVTGVLLVILLANQVAGVLERADVNQYPKPYSIVISSAPSWDRCSWAAREQKGFAKFTDISFGGGGRAWVRDGNLILNVARQSGQSQFGNLQIFELSGDHRLLAIGHASSAMVGADKQWQLSGYTESRFAADSVTTCLQGNALCRPM
jgi:hypothetical protein